MPKFVVSEEKEKFIKIDDGQDDKHQVMVKAHMTYGQKYTVLHR